jgi:hypothetical protein
MIGPSNDEWDVIRQTIDRMLSDNKPIFETFRSRASAIFVAVLQDKPQPFTRRPPVSLRLICDGERPTKLVVHPACNRYAKTVDPLHLQVELLQERIMTVQGLEVRKFDQQVVLELFSKPTTRNSAGYRIGLFHFRQDTPRDMGRVVDVMRDFVADERAVFARNRSRVEGDKRTEWRRAAKILLGGVGRSDEWHVVLRNVLSYNMLWRIPRLIQQ